MSKKIVGPAAINALKEALTAIYWYKSQLKSFLMNCLSNPTILAKINWDDYKRTIVSTVVDYLAKNQDVYRDDLLNLMAEVIKIRDFSHLERLEDGKEKAKTARDAVVALSKIYATHEELVLEQKYIDEKRKSAHEKLMKNREFNEGLENLKNEYCQLFSSKDPQSRGFKLEKIIKTLFKLFDLDPKSSFKITGEQIDGAFTFDNIDYLFEAKWQKDPVSIEDLDAFLGKVSRKLDNTLGLFLSINSFSSDAVTAHSTGRRLIILMDGSDLMAVLEERIDLTELLLRKRRHAAQTGNIYLKINEILSAT